MHIRDARKSLHDRKLICFFPVVLDGLKVRGFTDKPCPMYFNCIREQDLEPRTSPLQALCLASTGLRVELKRAGKKSSWMKTAVHQYWDFPQINLFPGIPAGKKKSSKSTRNPERAFTGSREVGGNLVPQNKRRMKQVTTFFLVWDDLKPRI